MTGATVTSQLGLVRLKIETQAGRSLIVGPFNTLGGAKRLAQDLIEDGTVQSVQVLHRNKGSWRPAWSFTRAALVGLLPRPGAW